MIVYVVEHPDGPVDGYEATTETLELLIRRDGVTVDWKAPGGSGTLTLGPGDRLKVRGWGE